MWGPRLNLGRIGLLAALAPVLWLACTAPNPNYCDNSRAHVPTWDVQPEEPRLRTTAGRRGDRRWCATYRATHTIDAPTDQPTDRGAGGDGAVDSDGASDRGDGADRADVYTGCRDHRDA